MIGGNILARFMCVAALCIVLLEVSNGSPVRSSARFLSTCNHCAVRYHHCTAGLFRACHFRIKGVWTNMCCSRQWNAIHPKLCRLYHTRVRTCLSLRNSCHITCVNSRFSHHQANRVSSVNNQALIHQANTATAVAHAFRN